MFTGIIEDLGTVKRISRTQIAVETKLDDINIGDSISVNGVCLTVKEKRGQRSGGREQKEQLCFDISEETFQRTNLKYSRIGEKVNLERALKAGGRFGGHFVTGHIDCVGRILSISQFHNSKILEFAFPRKFSRYVVEKGSIAIDGISLTIAALNEEKSTFRVAVVPHTLNNTNLQFSGLSHLYNIEFDIYAKYIEKFAHQHTDEKKQITKEMLENAGFI